MPLLVCVCLQKPVLSCRLWILAGRPEALSYHHYAMLCEESRLQHNPWDATSATWWRWRSSWVPGLGAGWLRIRGFWVWGFRVWRFRVWGFWVWRFRASGFQNDMCSMYLTCVMFVTFTTVEILTLYRNDRHVNSRTSVTCFCGFRTRQQELMELHFSAVSDFRLRTETKSASYIGIVEK
jgi:hypothetical protein